MLRLTTRLALSLLAVALLGGRQGCIGSAPGIAPDLPAFEEEEPDPSPSLAPSPARNNQE